MLSKLRRLTDLPLLEQVLFLQLTVLSLGLRVALSALPLPRLAYLLSHTAFIPLLGLIPSLHICCGTDRLFELSDLATTVSHRNGRCLPRSLLLFWLLHARQDAVSLCLGVSKNVSALEGHAWIEHGGVVFGDTLSFINRYTLVLRLPA